VSAETGGCCVHTHCVPRTTQCSVFVRSSAFVLPAAERRLLLALASVCAPCAPHRSARSRRLRQRAARCAQIWRSKLLVREQANAGGGSLAGPLSLALDPASWLAGWPAGLLARGRLARLKRRLRLRRLPRTEAAAGRGGGGVGAQLRGSSWAARRRATRCNRIQAQTVRRLSPVRWFVRSLARSPRSAGSSKPVVRERPSQRGRAGPNWLGPGWPGRTSRRAGRLVGQRPSGEGRRRGRGKGGGGGDSRRAGARKLRPALVRRLGRQR